MFVCFADVILVSVLDLDAPPLRDGRWGRDGRLLCRYFVCTYLRSPTSCEPPLPPEELEEEFAALLSVRIEVCVHRHGYYRYNPRGWHMAGHHEEVFRGRPG